MEITLKSLDINPVIFFRGTDAEITAAEAAEDERRAQLEEIIFSDSFAALEYLTEYGQRRILHHSTRPEYAFQLSYIDPDGIPAMHESFVSTTGEDTRDNSKAALLRHFINLTLAHDLKIKVVRREELAA